MIVTDPYRAFVFPNRVREAREAAGFARLVALSTELPDIPYIRLSKIERGEVFARPAELSAIAAALGAEPQALLIDVDAPDFDLARWAAPFHDADAVDPEAERFAVRLAAATRAIRHQDRDLTIAAIGERYGIAPVTLSRIENAHRPFGQWNAATREAICALFGVPDGDEAALRMKVEQMEQAGVLERFIVGVDDPAERLAQSRRRISMLRSELAGTPTTPGTMHRRAAAAPSRTGSAAMTAVIGKPGPDGLILPVPTGEYVAVPNGLGADAIAVRMCRPSLGAALPAQSVLFLDPQRFPVPGGLAALTEGDGLRILSVSIDNDGRLAGHSVIPLRSLALDEIAPERLFSVVYAKFI